MNGSVDEFGRALLSLKLMSNGSPEWVGITAWIDTAFSGELVVPRRIIESMNLEQSAGIHARLADGNEVTMESFTSVLDWFGEKRVVEVIANDGQTPLLGIGLLVGRRLTVDYSELTVTLE